MLTLSKMTLQKYFLSNIWHPFITKDYFSDFEVFQLNISQRVEILQGQGAYN